MSCFFYLAFISHFITIYVKIVQRVAFQAHIPPGNGGFLQKTGIRPFRALSGWRMQETSREQAGLETGALGLITH